MVSVPSVASRSRAQRAATGLLLSLSMSMVFAACSASDKPATAPILPDPETPTPPPAAVAQVVTTVDADTLVLGDSTRAHVVLRSAAGATLTGRAVSWRSSAPAVATVDSTGRVRSLSEGRADITASSEGQQGSATVVVRLAPVTSVTINAPLRQKVGESYALEAVIRTASGAEVTRPVTWRVRDSTRARITSDGVLTPLVEGSYMVEADVDGRTWGRGFSSYDWTSSWSQDALLWSEDALTLGNTERVQLFSLTCTLTGDFVVYLGLYGTTAGNAEVQYTIDDDAPVQSTWTPADETQHTLFMPGTTAQTLAFADRLAQARKLTVRFTPASGVAETLTWRVTGLAPRLTAISPGCRAR
jgi:hypothetical protein